MFGHVVNAIIGLLLWGLANAVYYDLKRKGVRSFARFASFWVGNPTTWITFFVVREGRQPTFDPAVDDEALLAEIRRDRALRPAESDASGRDGAADAPDRASDRASDRDSDRAADSRGPRPAAGSA